MKIEYNTGLMIVVVALAILILIVLIFQLQSVAEYEHIITC